LGWLRSGAVTTLVVRGRPEPAVVAILLVLLNLQ
jgi:hypothetical protein